MARDRPIYSLTHEFYPRRAGIGIYVEELARGAVAAGRRVQVWVPDAPELAEHPGFPFSVRRLPFRGSQDLACLWRLAREIHRRRRALREGVLHLAEPGPVLAGMYLGLVGAIPAAALVLTLYGSEMRRITRKPLLRFALGRLVRRADRVGVISDDGRKLFLRHYPWAEAKLRVVPGALRHDFEDSAERERSDPADRLVVLTVARIHPRKGQLAVIEALATLPADLRERIEYRLVGTTDKEKYRRQLEATAQEAGVALRVVGEVPDALLPVQYADADLFAMTSVPYRDSVEGFGLVYLEAGALGLPVVAHDIGGVRDAVTPDETGLLVAPDDRPGLAACFRRLLEDAGLREKLGVAGRARARSHSWVKSAKVLFDGV